MNTPPLCLKEAVVCAPFFLIVVDNLNRYKPANPEFNINYIFHDCNITQHSNNYIIYIHSVSCSSVDKVQTSSSNYPILLSTSSPILVVYLFVKIDVTGRAELLF